MIRIHVWVTGRVQGVSFRHTMRQEAGRLGVAGWVRNLPDGRVEAALEGSEPEVEQLVAWCRRGSPGAVVSEVETRQEPVVGEPAFHVRRTPESLAAAEGR